MTADQLAKLLSTRLEEIGMNANQLAAKVQKHVSHGTVYRALDGKPIKTDTMLALMDALGLVIVTKEEVRK